MDSFYIVASNRKCWTLSNTISDTELFAFQYIDNKLISSGYYLAINDSTISFTLDILSAAFIELENTTITTNKQIKCNGKYISYNNDTLVLSNQPSVWTFIPSEINPNHTFVIARYKENVNWVQYLPGKVIIYNKGDDIEIKRDNIIIEQLENVGREGHTYLHYMITHYDKLPDRVTFLQGDPFTHSENLLELICMDKDYSDFQSLSSWYSYTNDNKDMIHTHLKYLNGAKYAIYPINMTGHHEDFFDKGWLEISRGYSKEKRALSVFLERTNMHHKIQSHYQYVMAALFSVKRENILLNTREDYERIQNELLKYDKQGGTEGYILERLWYTILTYQDISYPNSFYIVGLNRKCWTLSSLSDTELCAFQYIDNKIVSSDHYLSINDSTISFTSNASNAAFIELENTTITTNKQIKYNGKYISYKNDTLVLSDTLNKNTIWTLIPTEINPNHTFVIAHYKENVNWVRYLPGTILIYNKGDDISYFDKRDNIVIEKIENVGREGHTYLHYMITHYDKLPDRVTFLQGDPFTHSNNLLELICMDKDYSDFQSLSSWYTKSIPSLKVITKYIRELNGANYALYPMNKNGDHLEYYDNLWNSWSSNYSKEALLKFLNRIKLNKDQTIFQFVMGALFSVKKENILLNTIADYERIRDELLRYNTQGGFEGYLLERLWYTILSNKSDPYLENLIKIPIPKDLTYCYFVNNKKYNSLDKLKLNNFNIIKSARYYFKEDESRNFKLSYNELLKNIEDYKIIVNHDCKVESIKNLDIYLNYLLEHMGEWNLFLGNALNIEPLRIVSRDPMIIECNANMSHTLCIYNKSGQFIEANTFQKVWMPYPFIESIDFVSENIDSFIKNCS